MHLTGTRPAAVCLAAICAGYFLVMLLLGLDRHWSLKTSIYDTGVFDQAIWGSLNGELLLNTTIFSQAISWLGFHFHPILLVFAPLYALSPSPEWLIIGQALAISLTAAPIYHTAISLKYSEWQGVIWALGFLLNPFVLSAAIWDFHPVAIAAPLIACGIHDLIIGRFARLLACLGLLLLCQEQFGLLVICAGISYYLLHKDIARSLCLTGIGTASTMIVFLWIFPALSPTGSHVMMTAEGQSLNRYNWLGHSLPAIAGTLLANPLAVLKVSLIDMEGYKDILMLLAPYGTIPPLLGMELLLLGAADFAANLLSSGKLQHSLHGYHMLTLIPVTVAAAMAGLKRIQRVFAPGRHRRIVALTLVSYAALFVVCIPHIFGKGGFWRLDPFPVRDPVLAEIRLLIPDNASLSVQANVGPHFSQRTRLYAYPHRIAEADFIVLKLEDADDTLASDRFRFYHHMLMEPEAYLASVNCLLRGNTHAIRFFRAPWLVFAKVANNNSEIQPERIYSFLDTLEKRWKLDPARTKTNECPGLQ